MTTTQDYPAGYWNSVFVQAVTLMEKGQADSAEAAYWLARRDIDLRTARLGRPTPQPALHFPGNELALAG